MDWWFVSHDDHPPWVMPKIWWLFCCWYACDDLPTCRDFRVSLFLEWCCFWCWVFQGGCALCALLLGSKFLEDFSYLS